MSVLNHFDFSIDQNNNEYDFKDYKDYTPDLEPQTFP